MQDSHPNWPVTGRAVVSRIAAAKHRPAAMLVRLALAADDVHRMDSHYRERVWPAQGLGQPHHHRLDPLEFHDTLSTVYASRNDERAVLSVERFVRAIDTQNQGSTIPLRRSRTLLRRLTYDRSENVKRKFVNWENQFLPIVKRVFRLILKIACFEICFSSFYKCQICL